MLPYPPVLLQVPVLRESLLRGRDWAALAKRQRKQQFGPASKQLARQHLESLMQSFELLCQMEEQQQQQQGKAAAVAAGSSVGNDGGSSAASILEGGGADEAAVRAATVRVVCSKQVNLGSQTDNCQCWFCVHLP